MRNSNRCLFNDSFDHFIGMDSNAILGILCDNYHGEALTTTRFEYDIPRFGKRIDVVLLLRGIIFCLEFKVGESSILEADIDQILYYALDLKNFHKFSREHVIVPILIATKYSRASSDIQMSVYDDRVVNPDWIISPYAPMPTIIEAAKSLYENHSVENITRHEADKVSTDRSIAYILDVIKISKQKQQKSICFVTGVPGAGKTLVGLDVTIRQAYQGHDEPIKDEGAVLPVR